MPSEQTRPFTCWVHGSTPLVNQADLFGSQTRSVRSVVIHCSRCDSVNLFFPPDLKLPKLSNHTQCSTIEPLVWVWVAPDPWFQTQAWPNHGACGPRVELIRGCNLVSGPSPKPRALFLIPNRGLGRVCNWGPMRIIMQMCGQSAFNV